MGKLVLDPASAEKLKGAKERTELFDENGRFVGMFYTAEEAMRLLCAEAEWEFNHMTTEECRRDVELNGVCSAEEVRQTLRDIRKAWESRR